MERLKTGLKYSFILGIVFFMLLVSVHAVGIVALPDYLKNGEKIDFESKDWSASSKVIFKDTEQLTPILVNTYNRGGAVTSSGENSLFFDADYPKTSENVPAEIIFKAPGVKSVGFYLGNGNQYNQKIKAKILLYGAGDKFISQSVTEELPRDVLYFESFNSPVPIYRIVIDYGKTTISEEIDDLVFVPAKEEAWQKEAVSSIEKCKDGIDNDGDKYIDCFDADCGPKTGEPYLEGAVCTLKSQQPTCCLYHNLKYGEYKENFDVDRDCFYPTEYNFPVKHAGRYPVLNKEVCKAGVTLFGYKFVEENAKTPALEQPKTISQPEKTEERRETPQLSPVQPERKNLDLVAEELRQTGQYFTGKACNGGTESISRFRFKFYANGVDYTRDYSMPLVSGQCILIDSPELRYFNLASGEYLATFRVNFDDELKENNLANNQKTLNFNLSAPQEVRNITPRPSEPSCADGCLYGSTCLRYGERRVNGQGPEFCDTDGRIKLQKNAAETCQRNEECQNNRCVNGVCEQARAEEASNVRPSFPRRVLTWTGNLFRR